MLLIQADRDALLKPLTTVTGIVERRHTMPILSNVLISKQGNVLSFLATDLEIQITCEQAIEGNGPDFQFTASAKKFQDILRAIPEHATVCIESADGRLTIRSGKSRFNLQTLPAEDFPKLAIENSPRVPITLPHSLLKNLLSKVQYAMAHQDIRYYLNGLFIIVDGNNLKLVATDGHRLAFCASNLDVELDRHETILPRKTITELYKLLSDSDNPLHIEFGKNQVQFKFGSITIHSKVVDGKFPDYNRVIPTTNERIIALDRVQLTQALQRAAILSNEKFRGVRFLLSPGSLKIVCNNSEQEEAQEELEISYDYSTLDIGYNIGYLLDVLNNIDAETLLFAFGEQATTSTLVTIPDNPDFKYVVMPMRI
ncbi:DNA polymerase III subunit beta [Parachitinimonas caeni]|uniref:Beta sliding clamp n=1 Tax=Parachitinimonas caeni TaxID=3031301 RepID=A0ABT7DRI8_9NEIS|nr:DNA polymerase III subunit beta [Parachitinimonas caeni]MDK2122594.1 DNA polymerase III subunit beta [Parachitinimonas caeni]